ncbi:MAG: hypothetical protein R3Y39_07255 [Rikenellaceae bacterium]
MAITLVMAVVAVGCSDIDNDLGSNLIPEDQTMLIGSLDLKGINRNGESILSTRLFTTENVNAANQTYGSFGLEHNEEFGLRRSGLYVQYTQASALDEDDEFGYMPFMDSMVIYISVADYSGDTTYVCTYEVYEVIDDSFLTNSADTIFNVKFDMLNSEYINPEPLLEFKYPDQDDDVYVYTSYVMSINMTESGIALGDRLMLKDESVDLDSDVYLDYEYEDFLDHFKGLYIIPKESTIGYGEGATYSTAIASSGFGFFGRSLYEEDPTIVADTIGMTYTFRNSYLDDNLGGVSIQTVEHDYSTASFDESDVRTDTNPTGIRTNRLYVEGMGGVVSEISFERPLFDELEQVMEDSGDEYTNMFFNLAHMRIYTEMATGDGEIESEQQFTPEEIDQLNLYPTRLALYNLYNTFEDEDGYTLLEEAIDYDYISELTYGTTLTYGGYLNRTQGCYEMHIPLQMQYIWNEYLEAKEEAGGDADAIDWDGAEWNKLYVAPTVDNLMTPRYVTLQGAAGEDNVQGVATTAPIRLGITYTLLKQ